MRLMQVLLPVALMVLVGGLGLILRLTGVSDPSMTLSLHAASARRFQVAFASVLSVVAGIFWLFNTWLSDVKYMPVAYDVAFFVTLICVLVAAWVPDIKGAKRRIHRLAAYGIVLLIPLLVALFASNPHIAAIARLYAWIACAVLIALCYMLFFVPSQRSHFLYYQALYLGLFFSVLVVVTYL